MKGAEDSIRLLRAAWRCSRDVTNRREMTVEELMRRSQRVARTFFLEPHVHRRACELALCYTPEELGQQLVAVERTAYQ